MIELIQETRKEMADWEKKFARSRGRITGSQKAKIDKLPLSQKKKVLALARKYATLGNKGSKVDPAHVAYNREMIKYKSETEREKRHGRKARKAHEKEVEDQINMARNALGVMKARDEIKKKRESSKALVPVSREEPVMLKRKEDTNAVVKNQPKPGGRKKSSVGMSKADIDWSLKAKLDDIARELIKTTNPIKRVLLKAKAKRLKKSYAAAKSLKEDHCKKPDSLDCRVEKIAKKYAKKEAEKENDEHEEELHEGKWDYPKGITSRRQDKYSDYPPYQKDKRIARKKWRQKIKAAKHKALKLGKLDEHEEELHEKAPPGEKYERMVKHIKAGGASKEVAYATAWKAYNKKNKIDEGWKQAAAYGATAIGAGAITGALVGGPKWAAIGAGLGAADYAFRKNGLRKDWNSKGWSDSKRRKKRVIKRLRVKLAEGKLSDWSIDFEEKHGRKPTNDDLKADYKKKQKQEKRKAAAKKLSAFVRVSGIKNGK